MFAFDPALLYVSTSASDTAELVVVELPGTGDEPARKLAGTISASAGKRLTVVSAEPVYVPSSIRIQGKDLLFLGDVVECAPDNDGKWSLHVSVKSKFMIF
jgi:hypothetical protein